MNVFAETSFLCALLRTQDNSPDADAWMLDHAAPIDVSTLVLYEFRQGVHFQNWLHRHDKKKGYAAQEAATMLERLEENLSHGIFRVVPVDWTAVHDLAGRLAAEHTPAAGARGFDLLHIATAVEGEAETFLSFDRPQRQVAIAAGLPVAPLWEG